MSAEPSPGSLEDILGVWDEQGPFPLRDKGDVALLVDEIERLRARIDGSGAVEADRVMSGYIVDTLFGWVLINGHDNATCDGCAEEKSLRYEWPDTSAWLCEDCWQDATETDRLRAELERVRAERDELRALAVSAMSEIDEEHRPDTLTTTPRGACVICWPKDGSWPCVSNLAMSDLRAWLAAHPVEADR